VPRNGPVTASSSRSAPAGTDGADETGGVDGTEPPDAAVLIGPVAAGRPAPMAKSYPQPSQNRPVRGAAQSGHDSPAVPPAGSGPPDGAPVDAGTDGAPVMRAPQTSQ
jgi:hypothetical protein